MSTASPAPDQPPLKEPPDFSLVLGGPLYQLFRQAHLDGDTPRLLGRRIVVLVTLAWVPLLILSIVEGHAWGKSVTLPFLYDVELHLRLLLALPLLIMAELVVHQRIRPVVGLFVGHGLIPDAVRPRFDAAVVSAMRLRNSLSVEVLLLAFVYGVGVLFVWRTHVALGAASWYGVPLEGRLQPSLAGWWLGCISLPLFQFLLLRWYFRMFIWARFLWQVSRLELRLIPMHPDRCGGLGFLAMVSYAFSPVLLAQGTMLAGFIANRIFYAGATLTGFKMDIIVLLVVMVFAVLGPLLVFAPRLAAARRVGVHEFSSLAQRYVLEFDRKWLRGGAPAGEPLIGSPDIQSLSDLESSFDAVEGMRLVPFTTHTVVRLAVASLLPVAPLMLTMISLEDFFKWLLELVF